MNANVAYRFITEQLDVSPLTHLQTLQQPTGVA